MLRAWNTYVASLLPVDVLSLLPIDVARNILMELSYAHTLQYCSTSNEAMRICDDNLFWKEKLDTKYSSSNGLKPSDYTKYLISILDNSYKVIYEKWEHMAELSFSEIVGEGNGYDIADVIIFRLDIDPNLMILSYISPIIRIIVRGGSILALEELLNRGFIPINKTSTNLLIKNAVEYNRVDVLNFLEQRNIFYDALKYGLINIDSFYTINIDTIKWLMERNILNMKNIIGYAIGYDRFDIVYYLEENGILPEQSDVDIVLQNNRIGHITDKLDWLAEHGLY